MDVALTTYLTALSTLIHLGTTVTFFVVILTVIRRHRPDAYGGLLAWAIFSLGSFVGTTAVRAVTYPMLGIQTGMIIGASLSAVCAVIETILFVRGIIAIAVPRRPDDLPAAPPYR